MKYLKFGFSTILLFTFLNLKAQNKPNYPQFSGIYPHLAHYNNESECGTGAVVPWADRLWVITYGAHLPFGSSDKLYEITPERDLLNAHGTFYELPAENADGFAKIRPIASHNLAIHDYASYRGLLVMTGLDNQTLSNEHIITSDDGKAKIWAGAIDDLWKLGKPVGEGGVWKNSPVKANTPSDAYLIGFYDKKSLQLSHNSKQSVTFTLQIDPIGHAPWMRYKTITVKPNQVVNFTFPDSFQARWVRFVADKDCEATAWLSYK
jgi:hypothetical protein